MAAPAPKTEAKEAPPAPVAVAAGKSSGPAAWLPSILVVLLAPAASWAVTQFALLPRLQQKLLLPAPAAGPGAPAPAPEEKPAHKGGPVTPPTYEFSNVVVNLAGTMGTRYLKTSFIVTGSDPGLHAAFEENKAKLIDVTLNVLSSLTLADLEEPGAKNVLREKLVSAYNQSFGRKIAEQVYFSDFVVQ